MFSAFPFWDFERRRKFHKSPNVHSELLRKIMHLKMARDCQLHLPDMKRFKNMKKTKKMKKMQKKPHNGNT